jgi:hypothetical protein
MNPLEGDAAELAKFRQREYLGFAANYKRYRKSIGCHNSIVLALSGKHFIKTCERWTMAEASARNIADKYGKACRDKDAEVCERNVKDLDRIFVVGLNYKE